MATVASPPARGAGDFNPREAPGNDQFSRWLENPLLSKERGILCCSGLGARVRSIVLSRGVYSGNLCIAAVAHAVAFAVGEAGLRTSTGAGAQTQLCRTGHAELVGA